jgi:diketogulonate reductase-like aldo/keto reductase
MPTMTQTQSAWNALEAFIDAGHIRQLGISNCYRLEDLESLYQTVRIKPAVVQNRFYAGTNYDRHIRAYCLQKQIIYQSFWTLKANPQLLGHKSIGVPAATHKRTPAQILFRYLTQIGVVPLIGTKSETHMREDLSIFDFMLSSAERRAIDESL